MLILPYGVSPSNSNMVEIIEIVKPFIRDLIDHANLVSYHGNGGRWGGLPL